VWYYRCAHSDIKVDSQIRHDLCVSDADNSVLSSNRDLIRSWHKWYNARAPLSFILYALILAPLSASGKHIGILETITTGVIDLIRVIVPTYKQRPRNNWITGLFQLERISKVLFRRDTREHPEQHLPWRLVLLLTIITVQYKQHSSSEFAFQLHLILQSGCNLSLWFSIARAVVPFWKSLFSPWIVRLPFLSSGVKVDKNNNETLRIQSTD
jgi:hypothetical protein